jgi:hypothetical protein
MDLQHALGSSVDSVNYLLQIVNRDANLSLKEIATIKEITEENEEYSRWLQEEGDEGEDEDE